MATTPSKQLETFPNPNPERDYEIAFEAPEFTCLCPMTGQPDFATIRIRYTPDQKCVELKSLKLYLWSFRDEGTFHEAVTNRIANDVIAAIELIVRAYEHRAEASEGRGVVGAGLADDQRHGIAMLSA